MEKIQCRLGDLFFRFSSGKGIASSEINDDDLYPVIGGNGLRGYTRTYNVETPCVAVGRQGAYCGNVKYISEKAYMTEHAIVGIANNKNDTKFLSYYLGTLELGRFSGQAAQPGLSVEKLKKVRVEVPPLPIQQKIANILSTYDALIQNYKNQITALQTAASELYKEWFVRFRFPGHKTAKFENGLPVGWKVERIGNLYKTSSGGTPSRTNDSFYINGIYPWIKTGELNDLPIISTEEMITEEAVSKSSAKLFPKDSLIIAMYGATIGQLGINKMPSTCNQACCVLQPIENKAYGIYYLYNFFKENRTYIIGLANGAAQQNLSQILISKLKSINPSKDLLVKFEEKENFIFEKIYFLQQQITNLTQQRDLLLPRLMSGKLEIE